MRRLAWIALLACFLLAEGVAGIRPRDRHDFVNSTEVLTRISVGSAELQLRNPRGACSRPATILVSRSSRNELGRIVGV
jgi:hypothetical protein